MPKADFFNLKCCLWAKMSVKGDIAGQGEIKLALSVCHWQKHSHANLALI